MAKLYVANTSRQNHVYMYRMPESRHLRQRDIPAGCQVSFVEDFSPEELDYVVMQGSTYGMKRHDEVDRAREHIGLIYNVGKPVPLTPMRAAMDENLEVLQKTSQEALQRAAAGVEQSLMTKHEQFGHPKVERLHMSVEGVQEGDGPKPEFSAHYTVDRNAPPGEPASPTPRPVAAKRRRAG
jgi:hypothetical protein